MRKVLLLPLACLLLIFAAAACGSNAAAGPTSTNSPTLESTATVQSPSPTTQPSTTPASPTVSSAAPTEPPQTPVPTPIPPLPPFDPADYINGDEIAQYIEEVGTERPFPVQLMNGQPELPLDEARRIATEFLNDSRIVFAKQGFRDLRVEQVVDFCDNGVRINIYADNRSGNPEKLPGRILQWSIEHTELTAWNAPYVTTTTARDRLSYAASGWDAVVSRLGGGMPRLNPPNDEGYYRFGSDRDGRIRVFDNPGCVDPEPVLKFSAESWKLLGLGELVEFPEEVRSTSPRMDPDELAAKFDEIFTNLVSFSNLEGFPVVQYCDDHRGVVLSPYLPHFGIVFHWRIVFGRDYWNNGIYIYYEDHEDGLTPDSDEFLYVGPKDDPYRTIVAAYSPDCSVEQGLAYVESIREQYGR